jgi:predicted Ser/Thr protein kinase
MKEAKEYLNDAESIADRISGNLKMESAKEARVIKKQLTQAQKELRHVKKQVNQTIKVIRAKYKEKAQSAGEGGNAFLRLFGKKGAGRSYKASEKRRIKCKS